MNTKILIIKLGYSETLDPEIGRFPSLGDVLRTTPMLWALREKYPEAHISWLVSEKAEPLLHGNKLIDRVIIWDSFVPFQLMKERYDVLINLEKIPGLCALTDMIDAWVKYGFRFDAMSGSYSAYETGLEFISYMQGKKTEKVKAYWQQVLVEMLGVEWKGQNYIVGYEPKSAEIHDVGFNHEVGSKWPYKAIPMESWKKLEEGLVAAGYTVSWQEGRNDLFEYMEWINSCKLIISNDSLGLHLAFAFNKKVIGLFGPTDPNEVYFYCRRNILGPRVECPELPCCSPRCLSGLYCMKFINVEELTQMAAVTLSPINQEHVAI